MIPPRLRFALLIVPALLALQAACESSQAFAFPFVNATAEDGEASPDGYAPVEIPGWTVTGGMTVVTYGTPGPFQQAPPYESRFQSQFFVGGPSSVLSTATQEYTLTPEWLNLLSQWPAPNWYVYLDAVMGGGGSGDATPRIVLTFLDEHRVPIQQYTLTPETAQNRYHFLNSSLVGTYSTFPLDPRLRTIRLMLQLWGEPGQYNTSMLDDVTVGVSYPDPIEPSSWSRIKAKPVWHSIAGARK